MPNNPLKYRPLPELPPSPDHQEPSMISKPVNNEYITFADLATKYSDLLPKRVEVCRGVFGDDEDDDMCISTGDVYNIHYVKKREMMTLKAASGKKEDEFAVPLNSSIRFAILYDPEENAGKAAKGYLFSKVQEIIDANPMPKVICTIKRNTASKIETMVVPGEVLVITGNDVIQGVAHLKTFSLKTDSQKLLPGSSIGQFTTKPSEVQMYIHQILKHTKRLIPSTVLLYPPTDGQKLPDALRSRPLTLIEMHTSSSLVATVHLTGSEQVILDIPSTLDVELKWIELNDSEMSELKTKTSKLSKEFNESKVIRYRHPNQSEEVYMTQEELYTSVLESGLGWSPSHSTNSRRSSLDAESILGDTKLAAINEKPDNVTQLGTLVNPKHDQNTCTTEQSPGVLLSPHHEPPMKHASEPVFQQYSTVQKTAKRSRSTISNGSQVLINSEHNRAHFNNEETYNHPRPSKPDSPGSRHSRTSDSALELYDQPRRISVDATSMLGCSKQTIPPSPLLRSDEGDAWECSDIASGKVSPLPPKLPERAVYSVLPQRERQLASISPPPSRASKCLPNTPCPSKVVAPALSMHNLTWERPPSSLSENFPPYTYNRTAPSSPLHDFSAGDQGRESGLKQTSPVPPLSPVPLRTPVSQCSRSDNVLQLKYERLEHELDQMKEKLRAAESRIEELHRQMTGLVTQNLLSGGISGFRPANGKNMMNMEEVCKIPINAPVMYVHGLVKGLGAEYMSIVQIPFTIYDQFGWPNSLYTALVILVFFSALYLNQGNYVQFNLVLYFGGLIAILIDYK